MLEARKRRISEARAKAHAQNERSQGRKPNPNDISLQIRSDGTQPPIGKPIDKRWLRRKLKAIHAVGFINVIRRSVFVWIIKGDELFYFPRTKTPYCSKCGESHSRRFQAEAADEYAYNNR